MKMSRITVLFLVIVFLSSLLSIGSGVQATVTFTAPELLGRPTDTSITVNVVPNRDDEIYFEYQHKNKTILNLHEENGHPLEIPHAQMPSHIQFSDDTITLSEPQTFGRFERRMK
jgi:hypothetical protein